MKKKPNNNPKNTSLSLIKWLTVVFALLLVVYIVLGAYKQAVLVAKRDVTLAYNNFQKIKTITKQLKGLNQIASTNFPNELLSKTPEELLFMGYEYLTKTFRNIHIEFNEPTIKGDVEELEIKIGSTMKSPQDYLDFLKLINYLESTTMPIFSFTEIKLTRSANGTEVSYLINGVFKILNFRLTPEELEATKKNI